MQISRNTVNGPKSSNYVLVGIRAMSASKNHLTTFCKISIHFLQTLHRMFKIVFRDSSLYPKQLYFVC